MNIHSHGTELFLFAFILQINRFQQQWTANSNWNIMILQQKWTDKRTLNKRKLCFNWFRTILYLETIGSCIEHNILVILRNLWSFFESHMSPISPPLYIAERGAMCGHTHYCNLAFTDPVKLKRISLAF